MTPLRVTKHQARRFTLRALGLVEPFPDLASALSQLGYVQLDPINVCGRMHDLMLRPRVAGYREGDLLRLVHGAVGNGDRAAFEHYLPGRGILAVFPLASWPMINAALCERRAQGGWSARRLSPSHETLARRILDEIRMCGPLTSDDIDHEGRAETAWGTTGRLVKHVLEVLFHRGEILIASRRDFRRVYDLPERVIPPASRGSPPATQDELVRWLVVLTLRQRRLVALRRRDLTEVGDLIFPVRIEDGPVLYCLREDAAALEAAASTDGTPGAARLLAPLDPLIYDRSVTRGLWDFDYTWEVYTPPAKRVRGYYALPVLAGAEIVGHVEPRADRESGRLRVVSRRVRRGHATRDAVRELAGFLGLRA